MERRGEEGEASARFPKLKLPLPDSPEHPFQASASVPFKWEELPGKPRPCSNRPEPAAKSLELPPHRFAKTPSPTTVLDGPYNVARPKFSSLRFFNDSFRSTDPETGTTTFESLLRAGAVSCRFSPVSSCGSEEAFVGLKKKKKKKKKTTKKSNCGVKMSRKGSFSATISSQIWTSIYKGIKQVMHWKSSKKSNKEAATTDNNGLN